MHKPYTCELVSLYIDQNGTTLHLSSPALSVGDTAFFQVEIANVDHIIWYLNDTNALQIPALEKDIRLSFTPDKVLQGTLAIPIVESLQEWLNNTEVFCIGLNVYTEFAVGSTKALLLIQGTVDSA